MRAVPLDLLVAEYLGLVRLDADPELEPVRGLVRARPGRDHGRQARRQLGVEHGRRDPDPLLTPALPDLVEARAVEELAEDVRDVLGDDPRAVVLDRDPEGLGTGPTDLDLDVGEDLGLLAGVERVVDGLLDRGDHPADGRVEAEQVLVLLEELRDRDRTLLPRELLSERQARPPPFLPPAPRPLRARASPGDRSRGP